ncbi:hypothetical protein CBR65_09795 [Cellvibrio sp. PSBB006]|nr:hypothetical protein CBR65_09795 [Cellvibrio sp. PSBB006]
MFPNRSNFVTSKLIPDLSGLADSIKYATTCETVLVVIIFLNRSRGYYSLMSSKHDAIVAVTVEGISRSSSQDAPAKRKFY